MFESWFDFVVVTVVVIRVVGMYTGVMMSSVAPEGRPPAQSSLSSSSVTMQRWWWWSPDEIRSSLAVVDELDAGAACNHTTRVNKR